MVAKTCRVYKNPDGVWILTWYVKHPRGAYGGFRYNSRPVASFEDGLREARRLGRTHAFPNYYSNELIPLAL